MAEYTAAQVKAMIEVGKKPQLANACIKDGDLSGVDFKGMDLTWTEWHRVILDGACLKDTDCSNSKFIGCSLRGADLSGAAMNGADLRGCDLQDADVCGANFHWAWLEKANLQGVRDDEHTKFFCLRCPEKGAFIGYKKCFNNRVVMLLIPADAKRVSSTNDACRCSKAKVLTITSFDFKERYTEATSTVDENFVYRLGEVAVPNHFTKDRWCDSTYGIHFWMERDQAIAY